MFLKSNISVDTVKYSSCVLNITVASKCITPGQLQGALAAGDLVLPHQIRRALDDVTAPSA